MFTPSSCSRGLPGDELTTCVGHFIQAAARDPFSTWLILPTERLVNNVTDHILKDNPVLSSRICTLNGLCHVLFEENRTASRFLSKTESKLLLTRVIEDHATEVSLFVSHGRPSSGTIDDLLTFMNVTLMRKVLFPACLADLQSEKSRQIDTIIRTYRQRLKELDLVDGDTILAWTIDQVNRSRSSPFGTVFIYGFHQPLPLEQDLFLAIEERAGAVHSFVPDGRDPTIFTGGIRHGEQSGSQPAVDPSSVRSHLTGLFSETGALDLGDRLRMQTFPSHYAEVHGIAAEICRLNAAGVPLTDIAVAFPGLQQELGIIEEVFSDFGIPWKAAIGPRLSRQPVVQFLTGILSLVVNRYTREDVVRLLSSPFFQRNTVPGRSSCLNPGEVDLVSRYALIQGSRTEWEDRLNRFHTIVSDQEKAKNYPGITVGSVERVQEGLSTLFHDLEPLEGEKSLRDHVSAFHEFLARWNLTDLHHSPDEQTRAGEEQAVRRFTSRLRALSTISWVPAEQTFTPAAFLRFVSVIAEEPEGSTRQDPDGVAVLGIWECVHQQFPILFIGGLVEGAIPRLTTRLPFTNAQENARMGTRALTDILREEQYYFITALLAAEKTVYLSAPLTDKEKPLLTSAFFERVRARAGGSSRGDWGEEPVPEPVHSRRTAAVHAGECIRDGQMAAALASLSNTCGIDDLAARVTMECYHRRGLCDSSYDGILSEDAAIRTSLAGRYGPRHVYSPTSLETYARCPFEFFLNRVIRITALPEVEVDLSARDHGTAVHEILNTFSRQWQAAGRARVGLASMQDATDLIQTIAATELGRHTYQSPLWDATRNLLLGDEYAGPGSLERFLQCEAGETDSPLMPAGFEVSFGMGVAGSDDPASSPEPVALTSSDGGRTIFIRGRIDRVDLTPDGSFLIYDYKTGRDHPRGKDVVEGRALQLPLYLLAFETTSGHHGIGGGYYTIRREVKRDMVLADETVKDLMVSRPRVSPDFAGLLQGSRDYALEYVDGIRNGSFPLPREKECPNQYCDYKRICRFDPYRIFSCEEEI
jgi:ATP-dependent helicase/DNAse subunit B